MQDTMIMEKSGGEKPSVTASEALSTDQTAPPYSASSAFRTQFASLSLHMSDRIRLLEFPAPIVKLVRDAINKGWPEGMQEERLYGGSHEFKLRGYPWDGHFKVAIHARRLVRGILQALYDAGWILAMSTDVSKKTKDKDTMLFRLQDPAPKPCRWMSVAFSRNDRIRLLDGPSSLNTAVTTALQSVTARNGAVQCPNVAGVFDIELLSNYWRAHGENAVMARRVLLKLITALEQHGFTVYASIDQKNGTDEQTETDTWHCCRLVDWEQGAPVYHA